MYCKQIFNSFLLFSLSQIVILTDQNALHLY